MIASAQTGEIDPDRNRVEIIRFASDEAHARAIDALISRGKLAYSTSQLNVWNVRTDVVRTLSAAQVPFEWLTRDVK